MFIMSDVIIEHTSKIHLPIAKIEISPRFTLRLLPCNPAKQPRMPNFLGYLKLEDHDEHRNYQTAVIAIDAASRWTIKDDRKAPWVWFHALYPYATSMIHALEAQGHQFPGRAAGRRAQV